MPGKFITKRIIIYDLRCFDIGMIIQKSIFPVWRKRENATMVQPVFSLHFNYGRGISLGPLYSVCVFLLSNRV